MKRIIPLVVFLLLVALLIVGLNVDTRTVASPFVNKPAPGFQLPSLHDDKVLISNNDFKGKVVVLNVWASWCATCYLEHPVLMGLAKLKVAHLYGLNYKDDRISALALLKKDGDPYLASAYDRVGNVGVDYGLVGVPETFILDKQGIVRYKHTGVITHQDLQTKFLPLIDQLNKQ